MASVASNSSCFGTSAFAIGGARWQPPIELHVEAPYRAPEDFKDAAIESDDAVWPCTDIE
jgi:hypothetical protein